MHVISPAPPTSAACAAALLDGLPPVMWFIRCQMRKHRSAGLSVPQFRALVLVDRYPTASLSLIAEHLGSSQPSASRLVAGLVTRGLITRNECSDDRRQMELCLTPRGRTALQTARAATQAIVAEQIESLSPKERRTLVKAMKMLEHTFNKH